MVNKVQLIGRLGKDPELKSFDDGNKIASFTLATAEKYKNKQGETVENTDWHNCVCKFTKQAEIAEKYLKKGDLIFIDGKIKYRSYESNGEKKYITEIVVERFNMLGGKKENAEAVANSADHERTTDSLPF